jgi:choline monooxygenase
MAGVRDFDRARLALPRLEVATFGPLVMLRQDPGREPGELDPLRERLDAVGFEGLRFVASRRHTLECNWKVFVDNYLDGGYHVPVLHAGLAGQLDLADYRTELFPRFSIQSCPGAREAASAAPGAAADFAERVGDRALYAWIHPATMINRYGPWMDVNRVVPLGPGGTEVVFDYYLHPDFTPEGAEADAFVERSLAASDRVQDEDRWISEAVQRGLASRAYERGRYAPRVEQAMHHFHGLLAADLARA